MGSPSAVLIDLLKAAQSPEPATRQRAEETLRNAEKQSGYALALVQTALRTEVEPDLRQLAALLLKKFVRTHWSADNDNFEVRSLDRSNVANRNHTANSFVFGTAHISTHRPRNGLHCRSQPSAMQRKTASEGSCQAAWPTPAVRFGRQSRWWWPASRSGMSQMPGPRCTRTWWQPSAPRVAPTWSRAQCAACPCSWTSSKRSKSFRCSSPKTIFHPITTDPLHKILAECGEIV